VASTASVSTAAPSARDAAPPIRNVPRSDGNSDADATRTTPLTPKNAPARRNRVVSGACGWLSTTTPSTVASAADVISEKKPAEVRPMRAPRTPTAPAASTKAPSAAGEGMTWSQAPPMIRTPAATSRRPRRMSVRLAVSRAVVRRAVTPPP